MADNKRYEKQFFNALRDIFVGAKVEGDSGYVNLMRIKSRYYEEGVFPQLHNDIAAALKPFPDFREELFDKLYTFFQRYFSESGSIYFRYTALHQNIYEKVYTDERDVILFWKTHMLYYVKTDRIFNSMTVEVDGVKFYFNAGGMELKKSNEKRDVVYTFRKVLPGDGTLVFDVAYSERGTTTKVDEILKALKQAGVRLDDETLNRAFRVFEKQSEVDFFINKDARAFLREQFDLWMYQYLFAGQNVWGEERLKQLQVLKDIAYKIIDFISQFEDELVKIWNKPKFVRNSHYVLTLDHILPFTSVIASPAGAKQSAPSSTKQQDDRVITSTTGEKQQNDLVIASPEVAKQSTVDGNEIASDTERPRNDLLQRLLAHPNMPQQVQEWRDLGMLKDDFRLEMLTQRDLTGYPLHPQYRYLPIDTKYFPDLELDILALFDDLDAALDGWLVHSENYQAMNNVAKKYLLNVDVIYIDPPYNASTTEIDYENTYKHASWLSMMDNRINISSKLLKQNGVYVVAIDENEQENLGLLLKSKYPEKQITCITIIHNPSGQQGDNFSYCHDYAYFIYPKGKRSIGHEIRSDAGVDIRNFRDVTGDDSLRGSAQNCFYPILIKGGKIIGFGNVSEDDYHPNSPNIYCEDGVIEIYPIDPQGIERKWRFARQTVESINSELRVKFIKSRKIWDIERSKVTFNFKTVWTDSKYSGNNHGTQLLNQIVGKDLFTFPKSIFTVEDSIRAGLNDLQNGIILDYFAGSGTTAHAVMNLNREDGGKRKYILVEMGEHFNSVILPRVKKVAFSDQWKDGKANGGTGMSHFVKYYDLEQYEDVLRRAHYTDGDLFHTPREDPYHSYVFLRDLKLLDAVEIDTDKDKAHFHPERLYPDIDLAETLSQRRGKWIKRITAEYVEFQDGEKMSLTDPDWQTIKPLVWWQ